MPSRILEAARNGDWQGLKQLFESAEPGDGVGIVLADSAAESAKLTAIKGIRQVNSFQHFAEWFASAFDYNGPAGAYGGDLSNAARNLDAIYAVAKRYKALREIVEDAAADVDDRLEASREITAIKPYMYVNLPGTGGQTATPETVEKLTGVLIQNVAVPVNSNDYGDLKLTQFRGKAQELMSSIGVDPAACLQRIKNANESVNRATEDLNFSVQPIQKAYTDKLTAALFQNGYAQKQLEIENIEARYRTLRMELGKEKPADFSYARGTTADDQIAYVRNYEAWAAKMQGLWDEQAAEVKKAREEAEALYSAAEKEAGDYNALVAPFQETYMARVQAANDGIAAARAEIGKIKDHVIASSPVTQEAADKWFDEMVLVSKNMQGNLKKRGYDLPKLKETMTEFYRMTGGRLPRIEFAVRGGQRAAAQPGTGVVYVAGTFSKTTFFHELAHILEDDERTKAVANRFLDQRTGRDKNNTVYTLKSLTGNKGYKSSEKAYKDSFIDPYVGKYYSDKATEVFSMGMQYFNSPAHMAVLFEKDPDHFNFMLGYMATPPRVDKAKVEAQQAAMADKKDTLQTTEAFLKELDKKIAKAGDFWRGEGFEIENYYDDKYRAIWPDPNRPGAIKSSWTVKGQKNVKRALWLHIAAGKPENGIYSLSELTANVFGRKKVEIPREISKNLSLLEGAA